MRVAAGILPPNGDQVADAKAVNAANRTGAKVFAKGRTGRFDILASSAEREFAYWTGIQHAHAKLKGKPGTTRMKLRTTEIFKTKAGNGSSFTAMPI